MKTSLVGVGLIMVVGAVCLPAGAQETVVFTNGFDSVIPPEIVAGVATNVPVQGYAGLGPIGNKFGGLFLRSPTGNQLTMTLTNLPPHSVLNLRMLFAAIDSLDGTGTYPSGDFLRIQVGTSTTNLAQAFRESFANAVDSQIQSYVAPPGGILARRVDLGFSGPGSYYTDSAYDFGVDPSFSNIPHTGSTAVITFLMEGPGVQPLEDESWAMDNLSISVSYGQPPVITQMLVESNQVHLAWTAVSNRTYTVQTCADLSTTNWTDLSTTITATNITTAFIHPTGAQQQFYRVKLNN